MKLALLAAFVLTGCDSCTPAPAPPDAAPPPPMPTTETAVVCAELVDGGCLQASDAEDVCVAVWEEFQSDVAPMWLGCLYMGGTVKTCAVPCGPGD